MQVWPPGSIPNPIRPQPPQPKPLGNGQGRRAW